MLFVCFAFFCVFIAVAYIVERSECVHVTFKPYNRELPYASIENRPHTANDVMHLVVCSARDSLCYSSSFFFLVCVLHSVVRVYLYKSICFIFFNLPCQVATEYERYVCFVCELSFARDKKNI